jgi:hypothetical protein
MAEIVNLRRARKAKARSEAEQKAAQNRVVHGTPKSEKSMLTAMAERAARRLDGHIRSNAEKAGDAARDQQAMPSLSSSHTHPDQEH